MSSKQFRPLLGKSIGPLDELRFPLLASPKYDGIRGLVTHDAELLTRKLKRVPNPVVRRVFGDYNLAGCEGELICGNPTAPDVMQKTTSAVMSQECKDPSLPGKVKFYLFDCYVPGWDYGDRLARLEHIVESWDARMPIVLVKQTVIRSIRELIEYEEEKVHQGYEGVMLRDPHGAYKFGRSTLREQLLLKWKRFEDSEGVVVEAIEKMHNANEQKRDERGYAKRSHVQSGMKPTGVLGALVLQDPKLKWSCMEFQVGSGFTDEQRAEYWKLYQAGKLKGKLAKYRYQAVGVKDAPRFPRFLGFRDRRDT